MSDYNVGIKFSLKNGRFKREVKDSRTQIDKLGTSSKKASTQTNKLGASMARAATSLGATLSIGLLVTSIAATTREFDKLKASLHTATGSKENAKEALLALQDVAKTTPYSVQELTSSFIKLRNMGLDPSEAALKSYGNTASAMGKSLDQMIEAVADAATGEFERLKEFGIKSKSEGDNVTFTFQGIKTTVKKEAGAIEGYLKNLGNVNFAGAMDLQAATFDGAMSNMGDSWETLKLTISDAGVGDAMEDAVRGATDVMDQLTDRITSGQLAAEFGAVSTMWGSVLNDMVIMTGQASDKNATQLDGVAAASTAVISFIADAMAYLPKNIEALIKIGIAEIDDMIREAKESYLSFRVWINEMTGDDDEANIFRAQLADAEALDAVMDQFKLNYVSGVLEERDAAIASYEEQMTAARALGQVKADIAGGGVTTPGLPGLPGEAGGPEDGGDPLAQYKLTPEKVEEQKTYWDSLKEHIGNTANDFDAMWGNTFNNFAQGIGDATASAIMEGQDFGEAMNSIARSAIASVISGLVQIGVKRLALAGIEQAIGATAATANAGVAAATGTAMATAYAPAAAMASLASFGGNSAPAMAGITATTALSESLALAGMAHDGIDSIPNEGTWLLDKGERVVDERTNGDLKGFLNGNKTGNNANNITVNLIESNEKAGQVEQTQNENGDTDITAFIADIHGGGERAQILESTYPALKRSGF